MRDITLPEQGSNYHQNLPAASRSVPEELAERRQWVCWRYAERDGKTTKEPVNPYRTGRRASTTDPETWTTYEHAAATAQAHPGLAGIGYVFAADDPYAGVDFDDCIIGSTGELDPWVADRVERLGGYAEVSPSGSGVKVWVRAEIPRSRCRTVEGRKVEIYSRGRYFAFTGHALPGHDAPTDAQSAADDLYGELGEASGSPARSLRSEGVSKPASGEPIPDGTRHPALTSIAGRLHDGTRSYGELAAELAGINAARCQPPLPDEEVEAIAVWAHAKEPCSPELPPELVEVIHTLSEEWYAESWSWPGGYTDASLQRHLIAGLRRVGTVQGASAARLEESVRDIATALNVHKNTALKSIARLIDRGILERVPYSDEDRLRGDCGAFVMAPRGACTTLSEGARDGGGTRHARPPLDTLSTAFYAPHGEVRKRGELVACWFEAGVVRTDEDLAGKLGTSRIRDVRRRVTGPLVESGLLEELESGYGVPGDYRQRTDEAQNRQGEKVVRRLEPSTGRRVSFGVSVPSEVERRASTSALHAEESRRYRDWCGELARKRRERPQEPGEHFQDLSPTWRAEGPDGSTRYVDAATGELVAEYPKEAAA